MLPCLLNSISPITSFAYDLNVSLGMKEFADTATNAFIVVDDEHADGPSLHMISGIDFCP